MPIIEGLWGLSSPKITHRTIGGHRGLGALARSQKKNVLFEIVLLLLWLFVLVTI